MASIGGVAAGAALASTGGISTASAADNGSRAVIKMVDGKKTSTIDLDWKEVYFTNCAMVSANDYDVREWAAPEFFQQAARELIEESWQDKSTEKLPETTTLQTESRRLG